MESSHYLCMDRRGAFAVTSPARREGCVATTGTATARDFAPSCPSTSACDPGVLPSTFCRCMAHGIVGNLNVSCIHARGFDYDHDQRARAESASGSDPVAPADADDGRHA